MDFIHDPYIPGETIAGIATPPGEGGIAIIRISGREALSIAEKVFSGPVREYKSHTAHYGRILNRKGEKVDEGLLIPMLGKKSYTGEDTIEIHCHGGVFITRKVLDAVIEAGARSAKPGEFTFKAFVNGRMDLAQAEAVQALIGAKNEYALQSAEKQLGGSLSQKIVEFQKELTMIAAILEAWVDFPEEGLEFATMEEICEDIAKAKQRMQNLADTFRDGRIIQEGISLCLTGCPNVGKSSLMNALLDKNRAIVSEIPGTTRDVLEDHLRINGMNFNLMDTAGIRQSEEKIEQEGIRRTKEAVRQADIIVFVLDATKGVDSEEMHLLNQLPCEKTVVVWNKCDLPHENIPQIGFPNVVCVSAKEKIGLDQLRKQFETMIWQAGLPAKEELFITNVRHFESLLASIECCEKVIHGLHNKVSPEFLSHDMRQSLKELGKIIGTNIGEDILSAIFSKFCIGK